MSQSACELLIYRTYLEVWQRGEKYANEGRVRLLFFNEKEAQALVKGTETYKVKLSFRSGGLSRECDCPYTGEFCKHMVAVAIAWDEARGLARPDKEEIDDIAIPPPAVSRYDIEEMYKKPLQADLETLRILADETALGGRPRPHARLPNMPRFNTDESAPLDIAELKKAISEIRSWARRRSYDPYFCAGEMVAAFCEVARAIKKRLPATAILVAAEILLALQKFNQELIIDLIDDSNGEYVFTEAHLDDLYKEIKKVKLSGEERKIIGEKLKEFNSHQGDY